MGIAARRVREFQRREREILDAALPLLAGEDWQSVTVEEIAGRAEIGKGTVYKHFQSKEEIYGRLALDFHAELLADLRRIPAGLDVAAKIRAILDAYWHAYYERPEYRQLVEYTTRESFRASISPALRDAFDELNREQMTIFAGVLEEAMQSGLIPRRAHEQAFMGPQALVSGVILMIWSGCFNAGCPEGFLDEITAFLIAGLAAPREFTGVAAATA